MASFQHQSASSSSFLGFSVTQPYLGATLEWLPALGTKELDDLINAFLPGPSSIKDKRTHIAMDFFEYTRQTGETFKFYAVSPSSFTHASSNSPADSTLYDSGYSSSHNVSPIVSNINSWAQSPAAFTPSDVTRNASTKSRSSGAKKPSGAVAVDFAAHPGMRIMTKDGRDVTNCASRGSKTKEQRDHAHLMRIIKACDSCRRKKIRCDPSHKRRNPSQSSGAAHSESSKPTKKVKKATTESPPPQPAFTDIDLFTASASFDSSFGASTTTEDTMDEAWDQFLDFTQDPLALGTDFEIPEDYDILADPHGYFTPANGSFESSSQELAPFMPFEPYQRVPTFATYALDPAQLSSSNAIHEPLGDVSDGEANLPYLNPHVPHGTNYADFNLYSSPSSDEEPQSSRQRPPSLVTRGGVPEPHAPVQQRPRVPARAESVSSADIMSPALSPTSPGLPVLGQNQQITARGVLRDPLVPQGPRDSQQLNTRTRNVVAQAISSPSPSLSSNSPSSSPSTCPDNEPPIEEAVNPRMHTNSRIQTSARIQTKPALRANAPPGAWSVASPVASEHRLPAGKLVPPGGTPENATLANVERIVSQTHIRTPSGFLEWVPGRATRTRQSLDSSSQDILATSASTMVSTLDYAPVPGLDMTVPRAPANSTRIEEQSSVQERGGSPHKPAVSDTQHRRHAPQLLESPLNSSSMALTKLADTRETITLDEVQMHSGASPLRIVTHGKDTEDRQNTPNDRMRKPGYAVASEPASVLAVVAAIGTILYIAASLLCAQPSAKPIYRTFPSLLGTVFVVAHSLTASSSTSTSTGPSSPHLPQAETPAGRSNGYTSEVPHTGHLPSRASRFRCALAQRVGNPLLRLGSGTRLQVSC